MKRYILLTFAVALCCVSAFSQKYNFAGKVVDEKDKTAIAYAAVYLPAIELWAITDADGIFSIEQVPAGSVSVNVRSLGYVTYEQDIVFDKDIRGVVIPLQKSNLTIEGVVVTAQKKKNGETTSYIIDRTTLEHAQIINISSLNTLLPGGKTVGDQNLASSDTRIALRSGSGEMGNASFGTAIDVDGVRLQNNSAMDEIKGVDVRNISSANIESVEIVTGIPSVEYGDLSNGIVKINTIKGKTPFNVSFATEPKTKQIALSKGWELGKRFGTLNTSFERTKSVSNILSPYTAYDRNSLSLIYTNTFNEKNGQPLSFTANVTGNIGGYNSKADPDAFSETFTDTRDYTFRGNIKLDWLLNKSWITNVSLMASVVYSDKLSKVKSNENSASTRPYIHTTEEGYFVASKYDDNPNANIILSPTGYWFRMNYTDSKPIDYSMKIKADWARQWNDVHNRVMVGAEWSCSGNNGRGTYYDDMRYAPTWREYRYDELPFMHNYALYIEDRMHLPMGKESFLQITAGLRSDVTSIEKSEYGTAASFSPRMNAKYTFWEDKEQWISDLSIYGGVGKSVKLPSFEVLYPSPTYSDKLAFSSASTDDNTSYYAYYTMPAKAIYNPDLKWQYTRQMELGLETKVKGTKISVSAFYNKTMNPYMSVYEYTPYSYKQTTQEHLNVCTIPVENRLYKIDQVTGIVTVHDKTGVLPARQLAYNTRNTFKSNVRYTNGSPVRRYGIDWVIDFARINSLSTSVRLDGKYYSYKGLDETICASVPSSASTMADGNPYKYVGYYKGTTSGSVSVSNGSLSRQLDMNLTITTHIPKVRMILSVRVEGNFYNYKQALNEFDDGARGFVLENAGDYFGSDTDIYDRNKYVAVYPLYYTTWEDPATKIPFAEKFAWAKEHDKALYNELAKMVIKTNTAYYFNANRISSSFAANINLTKEIGDIASVTFFAKNFFHHTGKIKASQTGMESSLFNSSHVPKFYYGISLKLKL